MKAEAQKQSSNEERSRVVRWCIFKPKYADFGIFWEASGLKILVHLIDNWYF
jgi:hypothetical protein